jgi:hypothetical protein
MWLIAMYQIWFSKVPKAVVMRREVVLPAGD